MIMQFSPLVSPGTLLFKFRTLGHRRTPHAPRKGFKRDCDG